MTEIKDIRLGQYDINLIARVVDKGEAREFRKSGKSGRVAIATVKDNSGEVKLTLWNDDIDKVNVGDKIRLKNCYVNEFQEEIQLTTGRLGSIEVIGKVENLE